MDRPVACVQKGRGTYRVSVGKPERKGQLRRPRHRWEEHYKMDLQEIGWEAWTRLLRLKSGTGVTLL